MRVARITEYYDDKMMEDKIDSSKAQELARRFLGQYHSVIDTKAVLENGVWVVTAYLGFSNTQTKIVKIDGNSGRILGYS
ncbi:protein of unknown function [Nitrosotalea devaniterrae]|uniref:PepSY domain-containing protein n=1 Tax=Nitrosotalea devaniterrae TaxID=1078905 RepID=A0A128A4F7_9ARCH|nr:protein of unknown function [Candidatus Nitrosotalea devanaterra]